jgi:hypothetical protein
MSRPRLAFMGNALSLMILGVAVPAAAEQTSVDSSELARCAAISSGNARLACYDALAVIAVPGIRIAPAAVTAPAAQATAAGQAASAAAGQSAAPAAAGQTGATASQAAPAAAGKAADSAARTANPDDPANFGLTRQQLKMLPAGPDSIKATVSQMTQDRLSHVSLVLDNGQIWVFTEPDPRVRPGDAVTIKRAALGSFLMKTPSRRSYRVERLN